jgi:hypothetical protein
MYLKIFLAEKYENESLKIRVVVTPTADELYRI